MNLQDTPILEWSRKPMTLPKGGDVRPGATWARVLRARSLKMLDRMWIDPPEYFCREPGWPDVRFAFTNYGASIGLQAVGAHPERVHALQRYFATYRSNDEYDRETITHVMVCSALFAGKLLQRPGG